MTLFKICKASGEHFSIEDKDIAFYEKISPKFSGTVFPIPSPSLSPQERFRRRLAFRNERALFHRSCDLTGKKIISIFSQENCSSIADIRCQFHCCALTLGIKRDFRSVCPEICGKENVAKQGKIYGQYIRPSVQK